jgi:ribosome-binding protein aMBF1 (putative translation factor)
MSRKVRRLIVAMAVSIAAMNSNRAAAAQKQFGSRMRALRQQQGLSQEELAYKCDLDRTYVGSVERGERNISLVNIHLIAVALGVSPKEFFDD